KKLILKRSKWMASCDGPRARAFDPAPPEKPRERNSVTPTTLEEKNVGQLPLAFESSNKREPLLRVINVAKHSQTGGGWLGKKGPPVKLSMAFHSTFI